MKSYLSPNVVGSSCCGQVDAIVVSRDLPSFCNRNAGAPSHFQGNIPHSEMQPAPCSPSCPPNPQGPLCGCADLRRCYDNNHLGQTCDSTLGGWLDGCRYPISLCCWMVMIPCSFHSYYFQVNCCLLCVLPRRGSRIVETPCRLLLTVPFTRNLSNFEQAGCFPPGS